MTPAKLIATVFSLFFLLAFTWIAIEARGASAPVVLFMIGFGLTVYAIWEDPIKGLRNRRSSEQQKDIPQQNPEAG